MLAAPRCKHQNGKQKQRMVSQMALASATSYSCWVDLTRIAPGSQIYVDPKIYAKGGEALSWRFHHASWKIQHEIWEHGNKLISSPSPSQQDLEAAVIQLQRAVELRDKLLDKIYGFENIPGRKGTNKYAIMADLGIIRPTLKIQLRELRNSLIHDPQASTVTRQECEFLADAAWYYLKVTDRIAQQCSDELTLHYASQKGEGSSISLNFETIRWSAAADGYVSPEIVLDIPTSDSLNFSIVQCEVVNYSGYLKFKGKTTGTDKALWQVIKYFFDESIT